VFLFDVSEECRIAEVPFPAGASKLSFSIKISIPHYYAILMTVLLTHAN